MPSITSNTAPQSTLLKEIRDFIRQNNATQDDLKELLQQQVEETKEIGR